MTKDHQYIYLDYAATTPVDPLVAKAMLPYLTQKYANSTSLHTLGRLASAALEQSRQTIAGVIGAKPAEIIFTGSATESNNLAIKGIAWANQHKGNHIIVSGIEHDCVLNSAKWLKKQGFDLTLLPVDKYGVVDPRQLQEAITNKTILVSIMHANNEIGTIEPIEQIGNICRQHEVYFHTDAAQSFGKIPIDVQKANIDLLTASAHKMYGPKGAALLFIRRGVNIQPLLHGGSQEFGHRSSTVNVAGIVGFAKAVELAVKQMKTETTKLSKLRHKLITGVLSGIPDTCLNGHPEKRLANNANFCFSYVEGEAIVTELDFAGIAASTASACASAKLEPSHVLLACGLRPEQAHGSLRLSLGRWTKNQDIDYTIKALPKIITKLRQVSPFKSNK